MVDPIKSAISRLRQGVAHYALLPDLGPDEAQAMRQAVAAQGELTSGYMLMCALSAGIATLGLLQSSAAVVIGAMIISPLMAPIAALGFGFASLDGHRIRDAARVVVIGAMIGIVTGLLVTWISPIRNATPEIIGRTQPTLLDLAIALLSGIAGGYATVRKAGGAAIGVAIATALMPPLATVGYGLGVLRPDFAGGAFLLFLTNLAAIAFSFALIARLGGAARPLAHVEMSPAYILFGCAAFLALATPLGLTLLRVSHETHARVAARREIVAALHVRDQDVAQLDAAWPLFGLPQISAVVIAPRFSPTAQTDLSARLTGELGAKTTVILQQVVAGDVQSQTRAMVDAAIERNTSGIAHDVPPIAEIRAALPLPVQSLWIDRADRSVNLVPVAASGWTPGDFRAAEAAAQGNGGDWTVKVVPPVQQVLFVPVNVGPDGTAAIAPADRDLALWALDRWGVKQVGLAGPAHGPDHDRQNAAIAAVRQMLDAQGIAATAVAAAPPGTTPSAPAAAPGPGVGIILFGAPPHAPPGPAR